ncbi:MAG: hypothetical protein GWP29_06100 [Bacteroidetes bacterium]|nr:hypothetical protein [Bacteroidota bacterium]
MTPRSLFFLILLTLFSCEKDDICLEGTPATPRMIVLFKDYENPQNKKGVTKLLIRGLGLADSLTAFSGDSIAIPLRNNYEFTQYEFTLSTSSPTLSDSLQINHRQFDTYINRACGYKSTFIFENPFYYELTQSGGWIKNIEKISDTLSDEKKSHLAIYH